MTYAAKSVPAALRGADPNVVGKIIQALSRDHDGAVTPAMLVDASRPKSAPLHGCFEWVDSIAGEKYREIQAGHIIRAVVRPMHVDGAQVPVRAFIHVSPVNDNGVNPIGAGDYRPIASVLSDKDMRMMMVRQALSELKAWEEKYKVLRELATVRFAAAKLYMKFEDEE